MPRILIAGCGYVGEATADLFQAAGWEVEAWTASQESARALSAKPYQVRAVDISNASAVSAMQSNFDAVIQCVSTRGGGAEEYRRIYYEGAANLTEIFSTATILFTSSTSVYAQRDGAWVDETSVANPERETGRILRETEQLILASGGIVARLAGIYGPRRSFLLQKFLAGESAIDSQKDRFINQVHRDDIAAALFLLIESASDGSSIFNIVDDLPFLFGEFHEWLATQLDSPIPRAGLAPSKRKRGESNKRVSNRKLRALGWVPRYPNFRAGMAESVIPSFGDFAK